MRYYYDGMEIKDIPEPTNKEFARQMRENAVVVNGVIQVDQDLWNMLADIIEAQGKWISVDERLPMTKSEPYYNDGLVQLTESERVLVIAKTPYGDNRMGVVVLVHDLIDDECDWAGSIDDYDASACNITHWMPLPEPPKGE